METHQDLVAGPCSCGRGRLQLVGLVIAVMVVLYPLLRNGSPWPSGLTYALNARLDEVLRLDRRNQGSSWIYVYFLNQISSFLNWLVTSFTDLLDG